MLIKSVGVPPMESGQCNAAVLCANRPWIYKVVVDFFAEGSLVFSYCPVHVPVS